MGVGIDDVDGILVVEPVAFHSVGHVDAPPEAESIGPDSVEPVSEEEELQSEAPADVAAAHGPSAEAIAEAEGEVDLDISHPETAPPEERPAGIPVEPLGEVETEEPETAA